MTRGPHEGEFGGFGHHTWKLSSLKLRMPQILQIPYGLSYFREETLRGQMVVEVEVEVEGRRGMGFEIWWQQKI